MFFFAKKMRTSTSEELLLPSCPQNVRTGQPLWLRTSFMDGPFYLTSKR